MRVLEDGRRRGVIRFEGAPNEAARLVVSGLDGALLVSRPYANVQRFRDAAERLLAGLTADS